MTKLTIIKVSPYLRLMIRIIIDKNISMASWILRGIRGQSAMKGARCRREMRIRHIDPNHNAEKLPGLEVGQKQHGVADGSQGHKNFVDLVLDQVPGTF